MDNPISEPIKTQTIIQFPVLAKFNLIPLPEIVSGGMPVFTLSPYSGIGINLFSNNDNIAVQSPSHFSFIVGIEVCLLYLCAGYQYNCDFSDTVYSFNGGSFSYLGTRSIWYGGMKFFIPFRKK